MPLSESPTTLETDAPSHKPARQSRTDEAYSDIRRRILDNDLPAGTQLLEQDLVDQLGMSRTPIREALVRLANERLVEIRPRHGMRVLPVSVDDMREIYEVLTALEVAAAESCARTGLTPDQANTLHDALNAMDQALVRGRLEQWATSDERFHRLLVDFAGNGRLKAMVNTCWDQAHRVRIVTLRLRPLPSASNTDHRALVDAIERRDVARSGEIHRRHREASGRMLISLLNDHGLTQI